MDDIQKQLAILKALSERGDTMTAREVSGWLAGGRSRVSLTDAARLLPHLKRKGYVTESHQHQGKYAVTPQGLKWLEQNL